MKWLVLFVLCMPVVTQAQTHVEAQGGLTIGSFSSTRAGLEIEPEISFNVLIRRDLTDWLSAYSAYSRLSYGCTNGFCNGHRLVTGNHGILGAEARWKVLWARTGMMIGIASIEGAKDPAIGVGLQGAWGVRFKVWRFDLIQGFSIERMQAQYASSSDWATALSFDGGVGYPLPF